LSKIEIALLSFAVIIKNCNMNFSQKAEAFDRELWKSYRFATSVVAQMRLGETCFVIQDDTIPFLLIADIASASIQSISLRAICHS
jgi:hypothetical protein